jgi:hypothetical protein
MHDKTSRDVSERGVRVSIPRRVMVTSPRWNTGFALQDSALLSEACSDEMTHIVLHLSIQFAVVSGMQTASKDRDLA